MNTFDNNQPKQLKSSEMARQGDVLFVPKGQISGTEVPCDDPNPHIQAYGEKTGHCHQFQPAAIKQRNIIQTKVGNATLIELKDGAVLRHEEHAAISFPPDSFIVDRQQEYDYETELLRQVAD